MKPRIFIGSSVEHLNLAYAAQENLEHEVEPTVWSQGVFEPSRTAMASLLDQIEESDFGLFIFSPDDITAMRDVKKRTVRDNVIFELGLFIGRLGAERCFVVVPRGVDDLHLPTDLTGLTPASFDADRQDGNLQAALGPACNRVLRAIKKLGSLTQREATAASGDSIASSSDNALVDDRNDCIALIQSWMGHRSSSENRQALKYDDVDKELGLASGSARLYIEEAATQWNYVARIKGKDFILFEEAPRPPRRSDYF
ncbi:TIR domain-containing protein [Bosea robiniae]|uniref:Predicted nucleotide-binding protein containing TIR-like domain-containing protein n=1 Tax=Bosea robiniae TaxID=1036780 RepID=A0ABY0NIN7_9HYPH|nr:nucleotide-binding protein [Bosea robiniae]SDF37134.1 Predicted nucleotide-binding protein containing TIR-like domain-containing protein [Bosea robiniae]